MSETKRKIAHPRKTDRIMMVYGFGEDKKPRAAKFPPAEYKLARKAADLMGLQVYEGTPPNVKHLHKTLSPGRIAADGSAFVPNISCNRFDNLVEILGPGRDWTRNKGRSWKRFDIGRAKGRAVKVRLPAPDAPAFSNRTKLWVQWSAADVLTIGTAFTASHRFGR